MLLKRLRLEKFLRPTENIAAYPEMPGALKVYCECRSKDPDDLVLYDWLEKMDKADRKAFVRGLTTLLKLANGGRPLESHYDEKKCHKTITFTHKGSDHAIWRIRNNDIRLLFFYGEQGMVLLIDSFPKHKDQLTKAQESNAVTTVKGYLDAKQIEYLEDIDDEAQAQ